jgi:DNA helicase-2/ATP-dependent DNA helicase PcrA
VVAAPRDRERVVMKASRFLEELPAEPELFERWQLDEGEGAPALGAAPIAGALPAQRDPRVIPALFGPPASAEPVGEPSADGECGEPGGDDVPF